MSSISESAGVARPSHPARKHAAHHSTWSIALHWFSALAVVVSVGSALWWDVAEDKGLRVVLMSVHRQVGLMVLAALALRLMVRFGGGLAAHSADNPWLMRCAAQLAHATLYALLLAMTLLGLALSNAHNVRVELFGLIALPMLAGEDADLADVLTEWHVRGAWTLLGLVLLHVGAACWHHWVRRDGVLVAMLPAIKRRH